MKRFWEIDTVRGTAVIGMIVFHILYIFADAQILTVNLYNSFWWFYARIVAGIFLILVGICLHLSYRKAIMHLPEKQILHKFLFRGLKIGSMGMAITLVSWLLFKERAVYFGILHLIGLSIILSYPIIIWQIKGFSPLRQVCQGSRETSLPLQSGQANPPDFQYRNPYITLVTGIIILFTGILLGNIRFNFYWFLWLGLRPLNYYPVDYLPLLPWYSFVLIGLFLGSFLYKQGMRRFKLPEIEGSVLNFPVRGLSFLGRHSLVIYFIHFPVLYGMMLLIKLIYEK